MTPLEGIKSTNSNTLKVNEIKKKNSNCQNQSYQLGSPQSDVKGKDKHP